MKNLDTLQSLIDGLAKFGDRPAVLALRQEGSERRSYTELAEQAARLARGLAQVGANQGDPVALLAGNRPEWITACLAVIQAGAVVVPLDVQLSDDVLEHVLKDSGTRFLFTTTAQAERLKRLDIGKGVKRILLDGEPDDKRSWQRLLTDQAGELPRAAPDDHAALFYTSGTTGMPKGVPLTHANLTFQLNTLLRAQIVTEEDRLLLPLPLHHVYPFVIGMLTPLTFGLPIILPQALTGPQLVRALREGEVTLILGVPRLYRALVAGVQTRAEAAGSVAAALFRASASLSTWLRRRLGLRLGKLLLRPLHRQFGTQLRALVSGGAPLDPELAWQLEGLGWQVATGYGLTETSPMLTLDPPGKARIGSVGRPLPGVEVRIDPSTGTEVNEQKQAQPGSQREEGEILARGPGVFAGYRKLPKKTKETFTADGWFRTGDLGYFDGDSYLYVTGRVATRITTEGGKKFQPDDVEEHYQGSPVLREVGVLQKDGKLVALIVPEPGEVHRRGAEIDQAIRDAVAERSKGLPSYQRITEYTVTRESLPRTQIGKIRRHELEERYDHAKKGKEPGKEAVGPLAVEEMSGEDRALLDDPAAHQVWDWLVEHYPDQRLTPDTSPQFDLGIDSMEWLNLTMEIRQRTGVELSDEAISRVETVRDLLREVTGQGGTGGTAQQALPLERPEEVLSGEQKRWLEPLGPVQTALAWCGYALNRALMRGLFRLRVEGLEHLPERGPFILAPNHVSYLDSCALAAALNHHQLRQTYWAGWTGASFGNPLSRLVSRLAQVVPIDPTRSVVSSLAFAAAVLKRGRNLVWYAEGQRSPMGELQPFKPGIGLLLDHFRVPVVPVFLHGTYEALPTGKLLPWPGRVTVVFGEPLDADDLEHEGEGDQPAARIVQALHDHVEALGRQVRDTHEKGTPIPLVPAA